MLLGVVVGPVDYSSFPDEVELLLGFPAFQEIESHVVRLCALGDYGLREEPMHGGVIRNWGCFGL